MISPAHLPKKMLYRVGAFSALAFVAGYFLIISLYVLAGTPPRGGEAWLNYGANKTTLWWGIITLSVVTDILLMPIALSLYSTLKEFNRSAMMMAIGFTGLFIVLDLAVTWPNYVSLVSLSGNYATASNTLQTASVAAANKASSLLVSPFEAVISILTLSIGILIAGAVMLKGTFGRRTAYVGIATGMLGIVSTIGSIIGGPLATTIVLTSLLTALWVLFVGIELRKLPTVLKSESELGGGL